MPEVVRKYVPEPDRKGLPLPGSSGAPISIPSAITVRQLADLLGVQAVDIIKQLMKNGIMANINQTITGDVAINTANALGFNVQPAPSIEKSSAKAISELKAKSLLEKGEAKLKMRPPVVTIMGHVDHGKTTLLDAIRKSDVAEKEVGSITQHIGAYQVEFKGQKITFLDTPGHEAFTAMRARGAQVTDITVLVVAADDGVMPQTVEAVAHARAAGVPIIVAINKVDKPGANPERVKKQLADIGLLVEDWGGDTLSVPTSAKSGKGIDELLESILLVAELEELKADPTRPAVGVVIEARMDRLKGPLTTVLVHDGVLIQGDIVVAGNTWGRVKAMFNDTGKKVKKATPSMPVVILGMHEVPVVGDILSVVTDEHQARDIIQSRQAAEQEKPASLAKLYDQVDKGQIKELNIVLKTDVEGSIEPIESSLKHLNSDEVKVNILHSASGNATESDVMLAVASKGLVVAFNTGVDPAARKLADTEGVDIRHYGIIYELVDDIAAAIKGIGEPVYEDVVVGRAELRAVFSATKKGAVVGAYVAEGKAERGARVRIVRSGAIVGESVVASLRRFKDDVKEVAGGYECGIGIAGAAEVRVGDMLEFYRRTKSAKV